MISNGGLKAGDGLWNRLALIAAACIAWPAFIAALYVFKLLRQGPSEVFFLRQDLPVAVLLVAIVVGLRWTPAIGAADLRASGAPFRFLAISSLVMVALLVPLLLRNWIFGDYRLSLDENLAEFDARVFGHAQLLAPVPVEWRSFVPALQPLYGLPISGHAFWGSSYLPMNAAFRALAATVHADWLVNPLWTALSVLAVYGGGRKLWPDRPWMGLAAAALLASSSQLLLMGMTSYAMPAHLALNLAWLWLVLRGGRIGHALAAAVAFVACGLHQVIFHPLFAAPFVLQFWLERRWGAAVFHTLAYAAICLFWVGYWSIVLTAIGAEPQATAGLGGGWFLQRVAAVLAAFRFEGIGALAESLVRFVTWQNPLAAPLFVIGAWSALNSGGYLRSLVLGILLTVAAMFILLPSPTHGWGYRYLHGFLGSVCLIAVSTWAQLTCRLAGASARQATAGFAAACVFSFGVLLPIRLWQAADYVRPYAAANAAIQRSGAGVVLVDNDVTWFDPGAVVRNDPYLEHGPKVMLLYELTPDQIRYVCLRYSVATFGPVDAVALGMATLQVPPAPGAAELRAIMRQERCGKPLLHSR